MTRNPETPDNLPSARSETLAEWLLNRRTSTSGHLPVGSVSETPPLLSSQELVTPQLGQSESHSRKSIRKRHRYHLRLPTSWKFWAAVTIIVSGTLGFTSVALLLKLPAVPNCPAIFWPTASASLRLYCAQLAANKQTVDDLLEAISLVNSLPADHPLRGAINRSIEEWSLDILKLAEQSFQEGKLDEAMAVAHKIPTGVPAYELVQKRLDRWQSIWSKGKELYEKAEAQLRLSNWNQAFREAVQLTNLSNKYWATTKFDELVNLIQVAREESAELDKAFNLSRRGGLNNLLEAVKLAEKISPKSYVYKEAQDLLTKCGTKLLKLAQERLDRGDWQEVLEIANKMPASVKLQAEAQDLTALGNAQSRAQEGKILDLEEAISLAQKLDAARPLYDKAQGLIARWQLEIEDVAHLDRARAFANFGNVNDLKEAIAEAQKVPDSNPRGSEAQAQVGRWRRQVETIEDQPFLDRADQLASFGNVASLQSAIGQANQVGRGRVLYQQAQNKISSWTDKIQRLQDQPFLDRAEQQASFGSVASLQDAIRQANQIGRGRVLYQQAQNKIRSWTDRMQRLQDQPYLDQAQALANSGNLSSAVAAAQQIQSGRVLYSEGRAKIRVWQREIQAQENLQQAYQLANAGTPDALASAIRTARKVPTSSNARVEARSAINGWSNQLLTVAQSLSVSDVQGAIAIAKNIPSGTDAYSSAQQQISAWQKSLEPDTSTLETPIN